MINCYRWWDTRFVWVMRTSSEQVALDWLAKQKQTAAII